jgi:hypothetical protein
MQWKCLNCGSANLDYLDICRICGTGKDGSIKDVKLFEDWKTPATTSKPDKTSASSGIIMEANGANGQIQLFEDKIRIKRTGFVGFLTHGFKGDKEILKPKSCKQS